MNNQQHYKKAIAVKVVFSKTVTNKDRKKSYPGDMMSCIIPNACVCF